MRIKVVTLVDRIGAAGGGERLAYDIATHLDDTHFESLLCVTRPSDADVVARARAAGVRVIELRRTARSSLSPWVRLVRTLRRERVDVLHSHKFGSNVWGSVLARVAGIPVFVAHEHSWSFTGQRARVLLDRHLISPRADAIVAVSQLDRTRIVALERVPLERVVLQPNGIPPVGTRPRGKLRALLGCDATTPIVGIVARLAAPKRVDVFIDAVAQLVPAFAPVHAVVVGDGPDAARLARQVDALGVAGVVSFLGRRDDVLDLAVDFDVAALSSDREGCPLTLLEYMALELPIVSAEVGGVADLVRDGLEALLVAPGDATALAAGIGRLLTDRALAVRLGRQAAARQQMEFDLGAVVRRLEQLYMRLLPGRTVHKGVPPVALAGETNADA